MHLNTNLTYNTSKYIETIFIGILSNTCIKGKI